MSDILARICADKAEHVALCKRREPLAALERAAADASPPRGFLRALQAAVAAGGYGLIAEIKKASPSQGLIRADFDPARLALAYKAGGAACLSVLTDEPYFRGRDEYLTQARIASELPVLRKEFMIDPYQVVEARAIEADCILIIMAAVDDRLARELESTARGLDMDALIEVHDEREMERALALDGRLIGINNRNLKTLEIDLATTERLAPMVPKDRMIVCESGLNAPVDLARMAATGAFCFLVGTSLMAQDDVVAATRALLADPPSQLIAAHAAGS
ncbi:MAG: indole-3-glycerol phosphate synthase TrpC [Alphaproteobacteria bacterium]|nr:indole-3-glycerol phosphate synthase TrpC [Alphaproteobacteria bacterium]